MFEVFGGCCIYCIVAALRGRFFNEMCQLSKALCMENKPRRLEDTAMSADLLTNSATVVLGKFLDNQYQSYSYYHKLFTSNTVVDTSVIVAARWHVLFSAIFLGCSNCVEIAIKNSWCSLTIPHREVLLQLSNIFTDTKLFDTLKVDDIVRCFSTVESLLKIQQ